MSWRRVVAAWVPAAVVGSVALVGPLVARADVGKSIDIPFAAPSSEALLGTDHLGRDVLGAVLAGGAALTLLATVIALSVTACAALLGTAAALRPVVGMLLQRLTDVLIVIPPILAIVLVMVSWPALGILGLVAVAVVVGTPYSARVFAAAASGVAASGYVEVAVGNGESLAHLMFREVLPNLRPTIRIQLGLRFVEAIYLVSTAAFLQVSGGFGSTNWASMVRENSVGILVNPWAVVAPAAAICVVCVGVAATIAMLGAQQPRHGSAVPR